MRTSAPSLISASRSTKLISRSVTYSGMPEMTPRVPGAVLAFRTRLSGAIELNNVTFRYR